MQEDSMRTLASIIIVTLIFSSGNAFAARFKTGKHVIQIGAGASVALRQTDQISDFLNGGDFEERLQIAIALDYGYRFSSLFTADLGNVFFMHQDYVGYELAPGIRFWLMGAKGAQMPYLKVALCLEWGEQFNKSYNFIGGKLGFGYVQRLMQFFGFYFEGAAKFGQLRFSEGDLTEFRISGTLLVGGVIFF